MNKQEMEAYLVELDEALAGAFPSPEPIRVMVVDHNHIAIHFHTVGVSEQYEIFACTSSGWGAFRTAVTGAPRGR